VGVSLKLPEDGNKPDCIFWYSEFLTMDKVKRPTNSDNIKNRSSSIPIIMKEQSVKPLCAVKFVL
jgi:hypothetical protein